MAHPDVRYAVEMNKAMKGRVMLSASKKPYIAVKPGQEDVLETVKNSIDIIAAVNAQSAQNDTVSQNSEKTE